MSRIRFVFLCAFATLWLNSSAQITFQKTFGGYTRSISRKTFDGGSVIFGCSSLEDDARMIRLNAFGDTLWARTYGVPVDDDVCVDGLQTSDWGFILTGYTNYSGSQRKRTFLIKTDSNGNVVWSKTFEDSVKFFEPFSITQTTFGDYLITGILADTMVVNYADIFVIKVNTNGALTWAKIYDRNWQGAEYGAFIRETADHGYIVAATASYPYDLNLIKLSMNGNVSWNKVYKSNYSINYAMAVQQTFDGGFILTGFKRDSTYQADILLLKTDSVGDTTWTRGYGGPEDDVPYWVEQTIDSGYIICGFQEIASQYIPLAIKATAAGDTSWSRLYTAGPYGRCYSVHETNEHGFVFTGYQYSGNYSVYHVRTDSSGSSGCNEQYPAISVLNPSIQVSTPAITSTQINPIIGSFAVNVIRGIPLATLCLSCNIQIEISGDTIICDGDSIKLEASFPNFSYSWNTGDTTRSIYVSTAGSYSLFAYDSHGCADSSEVVTTTVHPIPVVSFTGLPDTVCNDWPTSVLSGIPAGGNFYGPGISDSIFIPQFAIHGLNVIGYQFTDTIGCSNMAYDSIFVEICLDVLNALDNTKFRIGPNPVNSYYTINNAASSIVNLFTPIGELIWSRIIKSDDEIFNCENLPAGIYFLQVQTENRTFTQKLIKQ